jgi:hypothetical protein
MRTSLRNGNIQKMACDILRNPATRPNAIRSAWDACNGQKIRDAIKGHMELANQRAVLRACSDERGLCAGRIHHDQKIDRRYHGCYGRCAIRLDLPGSSRAQ